MKILNSILCDDDDDDDDDIFRWMKQRLFTIVYLVWRSWRKKKAAVNLTVDQKKKNLQFYQVWFSAINHFVIVFDFTFSLPFT